MSTFEQFNLPKSLQKAIDELGLTTPTPIQEKSFSVIMSGRDVMGIAQTGTGKTFAYLLPILKQWKFLATDTPRIVILVPTRELVVQIAAEVEKLTLKNKAAIIRFFVIVYTFKVLVGNLERGLLYFVNYWCSSRQ
jgi:ATP-dependent RNA helicase RhlE